MQEELGMANRSGSEEPMASSDRERQREVSNEGNRIAHGGISASGSNGGSPRTRSNRGFASMDRDKQKEIASKGGRAAHAKGTAHEFDSGEAREAGRKGGMAVSRNREHMAMIGRRGGEARGHARSRAAGQVNTQGTGGRAEGSTQNTRAASERQVNIPGQPEGIGAQGSRGGTSSLGGESRNNVAGAAEQNPNH
jgi:general stress protein YciG